MSPCELGYLVNSRVDISVTFSDHIFINILGKILLDRSVMFS